MKRNNDENNKTPQNATQLPPSANGGAPAPDYDLITDGSVPAGFEKIPRQKFRFAEAKLFQGRPGGAKMGPGSGRGGPGAAMARAVEKPKKSKVTLSRLFKYFRAERKLLVTLIVAVVLVTLVAIFIPSLQGNAIDLIDKIAKAYKNGEEINLQPLFDILIWMLVLYGVRALVTLAQTLSSANISQRIVKKMRGDLFSKIVNLPIKYIDTHSNGDIMSRMTNDVENVSNTVSQSLGSLVSGVLTLIGTIAIMCYYCWQLTLVTMITVVLTVVITKKLSGIMRKVYKKRSIILGALNGHSEEMITGYRNIIAFNKQCDVESEFDVTSDELASVSIRAEALGGSMGPIMNCISNIGFVIVAAFGGYFALTPSIGISIGIISAFIIYAKQFSRPINEIAQLYGSIQTALAGAERVFELIDNPNEDNSGTVVPEKVTGKVSFSHVDFSYLPGKQVLFDFSLDVNPGEKIALVGATGSGKTTIVNLLMRFYDVDGGTISVDGVNVKDIDRDSLRKNVAIVLQDTVLFSDTVGGNIKYADKNASDADMEYAAETANCKGFISRLPEKYDTYLHHAGASLSQGQRQLLAIARVVLANPSILILDEATSSVDTRTEKRIQDAMVQLMKNRTSLIIAHRLSTVRDADKIVVLDHGSVVEIGNHDELLKRKGKYHELYMTQFAGNKT